MRFIFISVSLLIISCAKDDTGISEKNSDDFNSSLKEDFNRFIFYEGQATYSINHNGLDREYILYIPPNIESRTNLPVIFNFHGYQGRANQFFNMTDLIEIANENGVVLVYPQGAPLDGGPSHWNAAPLNSSTPSFVNKSNVNDLEFFFYLLDDVNQNNILDLNRVYAIGYSNGGMFSHFLACNTENIFAAIPGLSLTPIKVILQSLRLEVTPVTTLWSLILSSSSTMVPIFSLSAPSKLDRTLKATLFVIAVSTERV